MLNGYARAYGNMTSTNLHIFYKEIRMISWLLCGPVGQECSTRPTVKFNPELHMFCTLHNLLHVLKTEVKGMNYQCLLKVECLLTLEGHFCYNTQHTNTDLRCFKYVNIVSCTGSQEL